MAEITIAAPRSALIASANEEIEAIAASLLEHIERNDTTGTCVLQARCILSRVHALTGVIYDAARGADDAEYPGDGALEQVVFPGRVTTGGVNG